jgi:hypothetical protein
MADTRRPGRDAAAVGTTAEAEGGGVELTGVEPELIAEEARTVAEGLRDPAARERYGGLAAAAAAGHVPAELVAALQGLVEIGLETGRVRRRYTAEGERAFLGVYARTPRGAAITASTEEVNRALEAVRGQVVRGIAVSARGPGRYGLAVTTDRGRLSVTLGRDGVRVDSVEVEV